MIMSDALESFSSSEAPPLLGGPLRPVAPSSPSPDSDKAEDPSVASPMKRPRVAEPITHFLTTSSLRDCRDNSRSFSPPTAALAAEETRVDSIAISEAVSPKQARAESASTTPRSPYSNLPRKVLRKTPVSSPTSSLAQQTLATPPAAAATASHPHMPASSMAPLAKRATLHQRWVALLHDVLMKERQPHESERVLELCVRIVEAIPGDMERTKDTFQTLLFNIKDAKNGELRRKVVEGELLVERLVVMDDRELANPELRKQIEERMEERSKDTNLSEIRKAMRTSSSTLFKCHVCGARDSSWEQRQTRSGDEPMTVIITCNKCNTQWRKY
ncbi:hypothetical protein LSCM1_04968 [Leishmania martiniquensis]|uniref:Transcription elongation factor n=1 Tax=Leishmania martiniquensis TaxID=1580590 RepID=A0A836H4X9_9TRYP|nr:hypothetical protein LSCM1_04968 [Leishmania martiniquensis]